MNSHHLLFFAQGIKPGGNKLSGLQTIVKNMIPARLMPRLGNFFGQLAQGAFRDLSKTAPQNPKHQFISSIFPFLIAVSAVISVLFRHLEFINRQ